MSIGTRFVAQLTTLLALGCTTGRGGQDPAPPPPPAEETPSVRRADSPWPITTRLHIDLWLHGFAMLQDDTALVPFFKRDYRQQMTARRTRANVLTQLDANRDRLRARFVVNPGLVSAQFLGLQFRTWENLMRAVDLFVQWEGDPRRAGDQQTQFVIRALAQYFPTAADRDWLRLFALSLRDEHDRFYRAYWMQEQRDREPVLARLDTLWEDTYRPKFQRFLSNTQSARGTFYLSLPLDGEGRTLTGTTREENAITVVFPETRDAAVEAVYVFAHEAILRVAQIAVDDNTTPTEKRTGVSDRYLAASAVRGGALLIQRIAPELHDGYMRYYLRAASVPVPAGPPAAVFERTFPLPQTMLDAVTRQLDIVLGGI
jgi:hypothetical protein